jgi:tetratricopeptide (TPR) repeat protein
MGKEIRIVELATGLLIDKWIPPRPLWYWDLGLSPDGREISVGGGAWYGEIGNWIYDSQRREARQLIDSPTRGALWSPDGSKLVLSIRDEAWIVERDTNRPTWDTFGHGISIEEFIDNQLEQYNRTIAADPFHAESYLYRALIHLYIKDFDAAQADLTKCVDLTESESDPMIWLLCWWGRVYADSDQLFQEAEKLLLQAQFLVERFPKAKIPSSFQPAQYLVRVYEAWNKPEEAEKWRAKLPQTEAVIK